MGSLLLHEGKTDAVGLVARDSRHSDVGLRVVVNVPADWCAGQPSGWTVDRCIDKGAGWCVDWPGESHLTSY
jgi:hypothetical protein